MVIQRGRPRIMAAAILTIVLAACASSAAPSTSLKAGGTLSIGFNGDIQWFDPSQGYDVVSWPAERLLFEQLVTYDSGTTIVPMLAAALPEVSADGKTYTFHLRKGVDFVKPDGTVLREMTADDVVYSLGRILDPGLKPNPSPVAGGFFGNIVGAADVLSGKAKTASGLSAPDGSTVRIELVQPDRTFLDILTLPFASVVPKELAGADATAFSAAPVGTGPYLLQSYTKGQGAKFTRNPHYWVAGQPSLDGIDFRTGLDDNAALQQVEAGTLDILGDQIPAGAFTATVNDPAYKDQVAREQQVATYYLGIDTSNPAGGPLTDPRVRQAIALSIDRDNILKIVHGAGTTATCILPPNMPAYDPACAGYAYNVAAAKKLLADAGLAGGFKTTIYTDTTDPDPAVSTAIQQDLAAIGIQAEIVSQEFATFLGTIQTPHKAPLVYVSWFQDFPDPSDFIDPTLSCATAVAGAANVAYYCNKDVDALSARARAELDPAKYVPMYQDVQTRIMADAPWAPIYYPVWTTIATKRAIQGGFKLHPVWIYDLRNYALGPG